MHRRYIPFAVFAAIVAVACVVVLGFDFSSVAHARGLAAHMAEIGAGVAALEKQIGELATQLKTAADDVKKSAETTQTELKNLGKTTEETKKSADEALIKHNEMSARMTELEQKLTQLRQGGGPERQKTIGEQVTEDEGMKAFIKSGGKGRFSVAVKAVISSLTTDADGSAGALIVPQRLPGVIAPPQRRMTIRDLLTPGRTSSNAIQYIKETGFTNAAATVKEDGTATKPQSGIKFDIETTAVTTLAHWVLATKQILDDVPQLQSYIDGRLRYGLQYVEEGQLLNGGGTGTDLNGIYTQATTYVPPIIPTTAGNLTKIDVIRLAILQAFLAEYPANGVTMNPKDWADIELTKTDDGAYLFANPQGGSEPRLWRLPVVETQAMTVDTFLAGAFQLGAQIFDREDANVEISTEDSDNFRKNLVTIRAEERLALAVYRPEAFVKGNFTAALAA
jgi:HK97 family phage major capsid protein